MNRAILQQLARDRLSDADALLAAGRWAAAYYLAGYAIECALKSCVLRHIEATGAIYRDEYVKSARDFLTHDFDSLLKLANLKVVREKAEGANPALKVYWEVVDGWDVTSRYDAKSEAEAKALLDAISNDPDGVFRWLEQHW